MTREELIKTTGSEEQAEYALTIITLEGGLVMKLCFAALIKVLRYKHSRLLGTP